MSEEKSIQDLFFDWLAKEVSPALLSDLYIAFSDIESFCIQRKILEKKLFETTDLSTIKKVIDTVEKNKVFRFLHKKRLTKMSSAIRNYYQFIKSHSEFQKSTNSLKAFEIGDKIQKTKVEHVKSEENNVIVPINNNIEDDFVEWMKKRGMTLTIIKNYLRAIEECNEVMGRYNIENNDLLAIKDIKKLNHIKTLLFSISDFQLLNKKQDDLLCMAINKLLNYRLECESILNKSSTKVSISGSQSVKLTKKNKEKLNEVHKTKVENYHQNLQNNGLNPKLVEDKSISFSDDMNKDKEKNKHILFIEWMTKNGATLSTTLSYLSAIEQYNKAAQQYIKIDLLTVSDINELNRIKIWLFSTPDFQRLDEAKRKLFDAVFKKLAEYHSDSKDIQEKIIVNVSSTDLTKEESVIEDISSEKLYLRYADILSQYFNVDGYQPGRAIFRGRFKKFYFEKYGCTVSESDEDIDKILCNVGTQRDGRIFPKQDEEQNDFINKIISDIIATLDEGASAIYFEAVYDKYKQQLADNLQIHHVDALTSLLLENANGRYIRIDSYLTIEKRCGDSANDILQLMKNFHQPKTFSAICEKAWYIPGNMVKKLLDKNKEIVRVAADTYFYAPNLPVNENELSQIITIIQNELKYRSYITNAEMIELINMKCPSVTINTCELSSYGLRNCLAYILRDKFEFKGKIISEIGHQLSSSDVYVEFVKRHKFLSIDDLKSFSSEMDSNIPWNIILKEMIRISDKELVRRDMIYFNVDMIDKVLDEMCPGNYVSLKDISLFLYFPNIGYQWNEYILESYLFNGSQKFKLIHGSFSQDGIFGAMVRVNSPILDYRTLIVDVLANSNALKSAKVALQYIVNQGYQQRKRYEGIEQVIQEAKFLKEQKEK